MDNVLVKLITDYGNASFDCGEEGGTVEEYELILEKNREARRKLTDYIDKMYQSVDTS